MHRDLKPENMILMEKCELGKNTLKLVDFGLSSQCDVKPYLFSRCGTPGFVAPEIINSPSNRYVPFEPKVDVFSAGIIFYIMLVGKSPFKANSFQEILDLNKLAKINLDVKVLRSNPLAADLIKRMTYSNPAKRFDAKQCLSHAFF